MATDSDSSMASINLLDLAATALSASIVAADQITGLARIRDGGELKEELDPTVSTTTTSPQSAPTRPHQSSSVEGEESSNILNIRLKDDGSFVTNADLAAQQIIVQSINRVSPSVRVVGEESEDDMALQCVTGFEERVDVISTIARNEIAMRYEEACAAGAQHTEADDKPTSSSMPHRGYKYPLGERKNGSVKSPLESEPDSESTPHLPLGVSVNLPLVDYVVDSPRVSVFIDPLDGTKAYARGDYDPVSILIAIVLDGTPCFGVICKPFGYRGQTSVLDTECVAFYGGTLLGGAYTAGGGLCVAVSNDASEVEFGISPRQKELDNDDVDARALPLPRAVISSSRSGVVEEFVSHLGSRGMINPTPLLISGAGEKSLRIILRSENEGLWFFPKAGTSLWDVAASDALLRATGGRLTDKNGHDMDYGKSRLEAENEDGVVACYDQSLHAECIKLFLEGSWSNA